jgi:hypothetical protein
VIGLARLHGGDLAQREADAGALRARPLLPAAGCVDGGGGLRLPSSTLTTIDVSAATMAAGALETTRSRRLGLVPITVPRARSTPLRAYPATSRA